MAQGYKVLSSVSIEDFKSDFKNFTFEQLQDSLYKVYDENGSLIVYLNGENIDVFEFRGSKNNPEIFESFLDKYNSNFIDDELLFISAQEERDITEEEIKECMKKYGKIYK
jgi:hypothetical protein